MIKTLIIVFGGLVAHIQLPNSTVSTAALPIDKNHSATLAFFKDDIVLAPHEELDDWFGDFLGADGQYVIPLKGLHVKISGLDPKDTDVEAVRDIMPSLLKVSSCRKLKKSVVERTPDNDFGFVDYSGGVLMANTYFGSMGYVPNVPGWDVPRCVPCEMQLITRVVDDLATLTFINKKGATHYVSLRPGTRIKVSNSALPNVMVPGGHKVPHFETYSTLFSDSCAMNRLLGGPTCRKGGLICRTPTYPDPDCTNSHYP